MTIKTAMILAAGQGTRLGAIGKQTHKGLLKVGNKYLLDYQFEKLAAAGIEKVVMNLYHLADQVMDAMHDGSQFGLKIVYSLEKEILGTGGGIYNALPLLGTEPFLLLSTDIWTPYSFKHLCRHPTSTGHLILVDNPPLHPQGDFALQPNGCLTEEGEPKLTYASIAVLHPHLFSNCRAGKFPLIDVLRPAIQAEQLTGEHISEPVFNTNTPEEWQELQDFLLAQ
jgi:MurNAc alpha-1-phosphate uridylyltransferase